MEVKTCDKNGKIYQIDVSKIHFSTETDKKGREGIPFSKKLNIKENMKMIHKIICR